MRLAIRFCESMGGRMGSLGLQKMWGDFGIGLLVDGFGVFIWNELGLPEMGIWVLD